MEPIKIVARYLNGKMIRGLTYDFFPNKDRFHVIPAENPLGATVEVIVNRLKAVFVVREYKGGSQYVERKRYSEGEKPFGMTLEVMFADGEVVVGSTMAYEPKRQGFFIMPADPMSNNVRIFAVSSAVKSPSCSPYEEIGTVFAL